MLLLFCLPLAKTCFNIKKGYKILACRKNPVLDSLSLKSPEDQYVSSNTNEHQKEHRCRKKAGKPSLKTSKWKLWTTFCCLICLWLTRSSGRHCWSTPFLSLCFIVGFLTDDSTTWLALKGVLTIISVRQTDSLGYLAAGWHSWTWWI